MAAIIDQFLRVAGLPGALADAPSGVADALSIAEEAGQALQTMQDELDALRQEATILRRRDETIKLYMSRMDEELRLAAKLQRDFLPKSLPQVGPIQFHTMFRPAGYVSGDLYDVVRLDESHVGFFVADAVGHGMPAALLTMFIKRALVTKEILGGAYRLLPPSEAMQRLNDAIVEQNLSQATFATALYGYINTETLEVSFASGGHPCPMLLPRDDEMRMLAADGGLLGIFPGDTYQQMDFTMSPGDRLLVYTDGIEVAFSDGPAPDTTRWQQEILQRRHCDAPRLIAELSRQLDHSSGSIDPKDDLTVIVIDVAEPNSRLGEVIS